MGLLLPAKHWCKWRGGLRSPLWCRVLAWPSLLSPGTSWEVSGSGVGWEIWNIWETGRISYSLWVLKAGTVFLTLLGPRGKKRTPSDGMCMSWVLISQTNHMRPCTVSPRVPSLTCILRKAGRALLAQGPFLISFENAEVPPSSSALALTLQGGEAQ